MFALGFTMEELMFPENYPSSIRLSMGADSLIEKLDEIAPLDGNHELIVIDNDDDDDNDDDWFTIQQLNSESASYALNSNLMHDQTLPFFNSYLDKYSGDQLKLPMDIDSALLTLHLPNMPLRVTREKTNGSSSSASDMLSSHTSLPAYEPTPLHVATTFCPRQSHRHAMSKSSSSLSFSTQSSTSLTSSSADEMSPKPAFHPSAGRRRRKRTIFSAAEIEHLKEAFIQNPKPSQQDIAVLSEQLGHDSYVIRVWFYNKRQATKKRNG